MDVGPAVVQKMSWRIFLEVRFSWNRKISLFPRVSPILTLKRSPAMAEGFFWPLLHVEVSGLFISWIWQLGEMCVVLTGVGANSWEGINAKASRPWQGDFVLCPSVLLALGGRGWKGVMKGFGLSGLGSGSWFCCCGF